MDTGHDAAVDGDLDGVVDGDLDGDIVPDCYGSEDCLSVEAARCSSGRCVPCEEAADCAHFGALSICDFGSCVECATAADCDDGIECSIDGCLDGACVFTTDNDLDGIDCETDCDDGDASNFPGNTESCDGQDNDCDGEPEHEFEEVVSTQVISEVGDHPHYVDLAWNGSVYAITWCDGEDSNPIVVIVDESGAVLHRIELGPAAFNCIAPKIAASSSGFGITWNIFGSTTIYRAVVQPDGVLALPAAPIDGTGSFYDPLDLVYNGVDRFAVASNGITSVILATLDEDLALASEPVNFALCNASTRFVVDGDDFRFVCFSSSGSGGGLRTSVLTSDGIVSGFTDLASLNMVIDGGAAFIELTADGFLIGWVDTSPYRIMMRQLDSLGIPTGPATEFLRASDLGADVTYIGPIVAVQPGHRGGPDGIVLGWRAGLSDSLYRADMQRISPDGTSVGTRLSTNIGVGYVLAPADFYLEEAPTGMVSILNHGTASVVTFDRTEVCF